MAITKLPDHQPLPKCVQCALCGKAIPVAEATIGLQWSNEPAFACNGHFWDVAVLVNGWAAFVLRERYEPLYATAEQAFVMGDGSNA